MAQHVKQLAAEPKDPVTCMFGVHMVEVFSDLHTQSTAHIMVPKINKCF